MSKGKLIIIEGTDGSGKATQADMLYNHLKTKGLWTVKTSFPNYQSKSSTFVTAYLNGEFGRDPESVNPYVGSLFFALDRYASYKWDKWGEAYEQGAIVISDRYTVSNAIHQAEKLPEEDLNCFTEWLYDTEYNKIGIPEPDLVIYLDVPSEVSKGLMQTRKAQDAAHVSDIHEQDLEYLERCRECGRTLAERCNWTVINCAEDGKMRPIDDIHNEIMKHIEEYLRE